MPQPYLFERGNTPPFVIVDMEILVGMLSHFGRCPQCDSRLIPSVFHPIAPSAALSVKCVNGHNMKIPLSRKIDQKVPEIPGRFIMCATMAAIRPKQIQHLCSSFGLPVPSKNTISRNNSNWANKMTAFAEVCTLLKSANIIG